MITIYHSAGEEGFTLTITGHALYAPIGQDIVCAAASMLWLTLEADISNRCDDCSIEHGAMVSAQGPEALSIYRTIMTGYDLLAQQYPENITLKGVPYTKEILCANIRS